ncbi:MAG: hypothetical protein CL537_04875 [Alcanivoracaceae bacterium]|nr:hypothetical protein [Alcanivoracaceae bacterium]
MTGIGFELVDLPTIFNENFFRVPDYQRGYSWQKKQVNDLLEDIGHLIKDKQSVTHFTGTLVLSRPDDSVVYHVVDGQQRLTTLSILISVVMEDVDKNERERIKGLYFSRGDYGSEVQVLSLNSQSNDLYVEHIINGRPARDKKLYLEADQRIIEARQACRRWLSESGANGIAASDILSVIENKLGFMVYAPKEDAETGIMFEVINNRGKSLSELEKVKNYLIYCSSKLGAKTLRKKIDSKWADIIKNLNRAAKTSSGDEGAFLRYALIAKLGLSKSDSQKGYEMIKRKVDVDSALGDKKQRDYSIKMVDEILEFICQSSVWYARLYGRDHDEINQALIPVFDQLRAQVRHASIMPLFLALVSKLEHDVPKLAHLLRLIEVVNFRVYMAWGVISRNDSHQAEIYAYAKHYYDETLADYANEYEEIDSKQFDSDESILEYLLVWFAYDVANDARFLESFDMDADGNKDFFQWGGIRYFLMNYEAYLRPNKTIPIDKILMKRSEGKSGDFYSVEHLWAVENNKSGIGSSREAKKEKKRLGNFALLELRTNIQGNKDDLEDKLPRYIDGVGNEPPSELQQIRDVKKDYFLAKKRVDKIFQRKSKNYYLNIYQELNNIREESLKEFAEFRWSLKGFLGYQEIKEEYERNDEIE